MKPTPPKIDPAKRTFVPPEPEFGLKAARNIVRVFVCLLVVPLVFEIAAWFTAAKINLAAAWMRSGMQWVLTHALHEGNRAVYLGREGWLFDQRELDRLVQAKRDGNDVHAGLIKLAGQLKTQETQLLVIAVPGRAGLYPEQIRPGTYTGAVRLGHETAKLDELKAAGIDVMDMTDALWEFRDKEQIFFVQDSHWTPEAMKAVALAVNKHVREKFPRLGSTETPIIQATILEHTDAGDLARELDPLNASNLLDDEEANLISIQGIESSAKSPVVLHGGELMRVFDDAKLSFSGGKQPHAGFATQLGTLLGRPLDVRGLPQAGEAYEDKKLVICLLPMAELVP
ncbi:MAG: alginate O-acetyltransferase AlgX-related protein [Prosthecobacter sp.]|uniref:alginate O-acetyltransferase AlgX-related protein n=1 Tax=Prosthecobacter sp. TaxID=1965333 RepID=UPI003903263E